MWEILCKIVCNDGHADNQYQQEITECYTLAHVRLLGCRLGETHLLISTLHLIQTIINKRYFSNKKARGCNIG